jgi:DNA helicase II / ATP-dependent DNA helicase PcrA
MIGILRGKKSLIRENFDYFFFDEFQDVSEIEFEFLKLLAENGVKIGVVGDDA